MKWIRQYEGPYLVIEVPSSVTAKIQRTAKARPKFVHIDKLKTFEGKAPKSWLSNESEASTSTEVSSSVPLSSGRREEVVVLPDHLSDEQVRSDIRPKRGRRKRVGNSLPSVVESSVVESSSTSSGQLLDGGRRDFGTPFGGQLPSEACFGLGCSEYSPSEGDKTNSRSFVGNRDTTYEQVTASSPRRGVDQFVSLACPKNSVGPKASAGQERSFFDRQLSGEDSVVVKSSEYSTDEGCVSDQSSEKRVLYQPSSVNNDDRITFRSSLEAESDRDKPKSSVQNSRDSVFD